MGAVSGCDRDGKNRNMNIGLDFAHLATETSIGSDRPGHTKQEEISLREAWTPG